MNTISGMKKGSISDKNVLVFCFLDGCCHSVKFANILLLSLKSVRSARVTWNSQWNLHYELLSTVILQFLGKRDIMENIILNYVIMIKNEKINQIFWI